MQESERARETESEGVSHGVTSCFAFEQSDWMKDYQQDIPPQLGNGTRCVLLLLSVGRGRVVSLTLVCCVVCGVWRRYSVLIYAGDDDVRRTCGVRVCLLVLITCH